MTYILSQGDLQTALMLRDAGKFPEAYRYVADVIELNNGAVDEGTIKWLRMAASINEDDGLIAKYVRAYTINSALIKGIVLTQEDVQEISSTIANGFFDILETGEFESSIIGPPGTIPSVEFIVRNDVDGAISTFQLDDEDWAGTLLSGYVFGFDAGIEISDTVANTRSIIF